MDDQLFKTVFKTIQKILKRDNTNELTIQVGRDGAQFRYMDPSHVSLTELQLYTKAFKTLNIDFHTPKTLTINADELEKILPKVEKQDEVLIRFDEDNIQLTLLEKNTHPNKNTQKRTFPLELLNIDVEDIPEPELKFQALIVIKASALIQALKKIRKLANSENTYFECTPHSFMIYAYDDENNKISENFKKTELPKIQTENKVRTIYDSDYILTIIEGLKQYIYNLQIQYSQNIPLLLIANLSNSRHAGNYLSYLGHVKFYLAPRILDK